MRSELRPRPATLRLAALRLAALVAALALALAGCGGDGGEAPAAGTPAPAAEAPAAPEVQERTVRTVTPESGTLTATRSASAEVRAERDATVAASASARVIEILARPGDVVAAGDPVLRLDDAQAELQLRNAELAVRQAEVDLERARRSSSEGAGQAQASLRAAEANAALLRDQIADVQALVEIGGAAQSDLRSLEAQLEQAESQVRQARDAVARAGRSDEEDVALLELRLEQARVQVEQARQALEDAEVRAPFDGRIVELAVEVGEFAAAGQPAFRLQSVEAREAVFDVPPEDAMHLQEQGTVILRYGGRELEGTIVASARPAQQPRSVRLTARLGGEAAANVPAGVTVELRYTVPLAEGTLVPSSAVSAEGGATYVYVARDGLATRVPVEVVAEAAATAAVEGLEPDAAIISPRPLDVREGTRVRIAGG